MGIHAQHPASAATMVNATHLLATPFERTRLERSLA